VLGGALLDAAGEDARDVLLDGVDLGGPFRGLGQPLPAELAGHEVRVRCHARRDVAAEGLRNPRALGRRIEMQLGLAHAASVFFFAGASAAPTSPARVAHTPMSAASASSWSAGPSPSPRRAFASLTAA